MSVIQVNNLTKSYGTVCALEDINLTMEENKIYGLLGRNGAGKTTLLSLLSNRLFPDGGTVEIDGENVRENDRALQKLFYMSEAQLYPEAMTVQKSFGWTKAFYPQFDLEYAAALCKKFGLDPKKKMKALSTGYSSVAKLILALSVNTPIVAYDEPILGLDAHHRDLFYRELISNYTDHPKTVILSTHIIEEISSLLERVIFIRERKVAVDDSVERLLAGAYTVSGSEDAVKNFTQGRQCVNWERMGRFTSATLLGQPAGRERQQAGNLGLELTGVELQKLFIYLTREEGEEA